MNFIDIPEERLPHDSDIMPIVVWCNQQFGTVCVKWQGYYHEENGAFRFEFKSEEDAVLFSLRWL
jgi:hypothetical protein